MIKANPMESGQVNNHSEALYSLCSRPRLSTTHAAFMHDKIKALTDCFKLYSTHLDEKNREIAANQTRNQPVCEVCENTTV